ncbi:MAG: hypothetical protein KDA84_21895, partial [Planctomycetaceae bacterium]|nr:hypothetical protein [Planctomycetaceae bacterium]
WLNGLFIQLKRAGLAVRRFFASIKRAGAWLLLALLATLKWVVVFPPKAIHWLWTSLFWPTEEDESPIPSTSPRKIAHLDKLTKSPFTGPTLWERFQSRIAAFWRSVCRGTRIGQIHLRRGLFRFRMAFQKHTAWTLATVTGTLGIMLMLVMQLMYSFQTLKAKESPASSPQYHTAAKTRIDPGFPQLRSGEPQDSEDIAQIDPFAPAQPDPNGLPQGVPTLPPQIPEFQEPLDNLPPLEPLPTTPNRQPPREPERFVDPLDNLPPFDPGQYAPDPQTPRYPEPGPIPNSPIPSFPTEPTPPTPRATEPPPSNNSVFEPPYQEPSRPTQPAPGETPPTLPPQPESNPFVDPLDNLPLYPSEPIRNLPTVQPETPRGLAPQNPAMPAVGEPNPPEQPPSFDPLDNFPARSPEPASPSEFVPRPTPNPVENPPKGESNPFVDPLDFPARSPEPSGPSEFVPGPVPMENPSKGEPNGFVDPLDN